MVNIPTSTGSIEQYTSYLAQNINSKEHHGCTIVGVPDGSCFLSAFLSIFEHSGAYATEFIRCLATIQANTVNGATDVTAVLAEHPWIPVTYNNDLHESQYSTCVYLLDYKGSQHCFALIGPQGRLQPRGVVYNGGMLMTKKFERETIRSRCTDYKTRDSTNFRQTLKNFTQE